MYRIGNTQVWVHDQDEALEFYTKKLGMEVRSDVTMAELGNFRWLAVGPVGQDDFAIVLMAIPGPPMFDAEMAAQIRDLLAKGGTSTVFLVTDDCQKPTKISRRGASSSRRRPKIARTASTPASVIPLATTSGSPRSRISADPDRQKRRTGRIDFDAWTSTFA